MRASDKGLVPRTNDAQVTIRIRREGLPFFSDSEYVVTVPEDLSVAATVFDLDATEPRVGVSNTAFIIATYARRNSRQIFEKIFLHILEKKGLTFHVNFLLLRKQFSVKSSYFFWKRREKFVCC